MRLVLVISAEVMSSERGPGREEEEELAKRELGATAVQKMNLLGKMDQIRHTQIYKSYGDKQ